MGLLVRLQPKHGGRASSQIDWTHALMGIVAEAVSLQLVSMPNRIRVTARPIQVIRDC